MKKNNVVVVLVISVLVSFIMGAFGGLIILNDGSDSNTVVRHNSVVMTEENSINKGVLAVYDAVVVVEGFKDNKIVSTGTGFVYKKENDMLYVMTNHHVIDGVNDVKLIFSNNEVVDARIMGSEAYSDIAVLAFSSNDNASVAVMGDSNKLSVGDTLFTVGAPSGADYAGTVTKGILSGKDRLVELSSSTIGNYYMKVMQTDAAINPGNSGGPICNINGEVVGITNMKLVDATVEGIGFAIPIEDALFYAATLEKGKEVIRPFVGIGMIDVTDAMTLYKNGIILDESIDSGVAVIEVSDNSPASKAGLKKGDVILSFDDIKIKSIAEFRYELYKHKVGDIVSVEYIRGNKIKKTEIKLVENK